MIGLLSIAFLDVGPVLAIALVMYVTFVGVFIDLDHFIIVRLRTGTWETLVHCLRHPITAFVDQDGMFDGNVGSYRWVSHALVASGLVIATAIVSWPVAMVTAAVLLVHVASDIAYALMYG